MTQAWQNLPFAPAPGTIVCPLSTLSGAVASFDLDGFPLIVVRSAHGLRGYVNACPHQYLPLDWRSKSILSADGRVLRCSNHAAGFDAATGIGIDGPGKDCLLDMVPLEERDGQIVIGKPI